MNPKDIPSRQFLEDLIDYNPSTGRFRWRPRRAEHYDHPQTRDSNAASFNASFAGKDISLKFNPEGYPYIRLFGHLYRANRVAWAMTRGDAPPHVRAKDGDHANLRLENLVAGDPIFTSKNLTIRSNNTSGVLGVHWSASRQLWRAQIFVNGKLKYLGCYRTMERAESARRAAERRYGFKPTPGKEVAA